MSSGHARGSERRELRRAAGQRFRFRSVLVQKGETIMKMILTAFALAAIATVAQAQTPQPADWTTLTMTANLNKSADAAWERIGGNDWCGIGKFLDVKSCAINSGKGEVGSLRTINGSIVEIVVARTPHSYTYAQPFTPSILSRHFGGRARGPGTFQAGLYPDLEPNGGGRRQGPGGCAHLAPDQIPGSGGQDGGGSERGLERFWFEVVH